MGQIKVQHYSGTTGTQYCSVQKPRARPNEAHRLKGCYETVF